MIELSAMNAVPKLPLVTLDAGIEGISLATKDPADVTIPLLETVTFP